MRMRVKGLAVEAMMLDKGRMLDIRSDFVHKTVCFTIDIIIR